jgi:hypothetical protein
MVAVMRISSGQWWTGPLISCWTNIIIPDCRMLPKEEMRVLKNSVIVVGNCVSVQLGRFRMREFRGLLIRQTAESLSCIFMGSGE